METERQLKSQQMARRLAMQKLQAETQSKMQVKQAEVAFEIEKMKNEANLKACLCSRSLIITNSYVDMSESSLQQREMNVKRLSLTA